MPSHDLGRIDREERVAYGPEGHASPRAALIYQHATAERAIADALDRLVAGALAASPLPEAPTPLRTADGANS